MSSRLEVLILPTALVAVLAGCGGDGESSFGRGTGSGNGVITVSVTDAPVDFASHVYLEFAAIELTPATGNKVTLDISPDRSIDLLTLGNGASTVLVQNQSVPVGRYTAMRFLINARSASQSNSYVDLDTGGRFPIVVPSGSEDGLTITRDFTIGQSGRLDVIVDFDLRKSLLAPVGAETSYTFKPFLRTIDGARVGTITGTVGSNLVAGVCAPFVYVFAGANVVPDDIDLASDIDPLVSVPVKLDNSSGLYTYRASFLEAGSYTVSFACLTGTQDHPEAEDLLSFLRIQQASVTANQTLTLDFTS